MIYSVWNNATRSYEYYDAPGTSETHAGSPPGMNGGLLGATPDQAAWRLPAGSRRAGSGYQAQGRIASLSDSGEGISVTKLIIYPVIGYLLWKALR